jgi:hypothetical protein
MFEEKKSKDELLSSLFQNDPKIIESIPYHQLMGDVRNELIEFFYICLLPDARRYRARSDTSTMGARTYIEMFTRNLFESVLTYCKYSKTGRYPLPEILFHGTTTKFLPKILEEGINPSVAGQCWTEDKEKRIFLTDNLYAAERFAHNAMTKFGGNPAILIVASESLGCRFKAGPERFRRNHPTIFDYYSQFWCEESIPPEKILDRLILPKSQSISEIFTQVIDYYCKR